MCRFKPNHGLAGNRGQSPGLRTITIWCFVQEAHSMPHNVTAQMAPVDDIQLLMLVKQTAKQHDLGAPTVHATHRAVTPTYCTGCLLLHRTQPHYIFVTNSLVNFHRESGCGGQGRWSPTPFVERSTPQIAYLRKVSPTIVLL